MNHEPEETCKEEEEKRYNEFKCNGLRLNSKISLWPYSKTGIITQFQDSRMF